MIAYLSDASRFIAGYCVFDEATIERAISVIERSISRYGKPLNLNVDLMDSGCSEKKQLANLIKNTTNRKITDYL